VGEVVRVVCKLRGLDVAAEVAPLPFVDPEGGRLRA
jgi:hypothetical protein